MWETTYPSPSFVVPNSVHLCNGIGKEAGESTGHGGGGEEESLTNGHLICAVPHGEVVGDARV